MDIGMGACAQEIREARHTPGSSAADGGASAASIPDPAVFAEERRAHLPPRCGCGSATRAGSSTPATSSHRRAWRAQRHRRAPRGRRDPRVPQTAARIAAPKSPLAVPATPATSSAPTAPGPTAPTARTRLGAPRTRAAARTGAHAWPAAPRAGGAASGLSRASCSAATPPWRATCATLPRAGGARRLRQPGGPARRTARVEAAGGRIACSATAATGSCSSRTPSTCCTRAITAPQRHRRRRPRRPWRRSRHSIEWDIVKSNGLTSARMGTACRSRRCRASHCWMDGFSPRRSTRMRQSTESHRRPATCRLMVERYGEKRATDDHSPSTATTPSSIEPVRELAHGADPRAAAGGRRLHRAATASSSA